MTIKRVTWIADDLNEWPNPKGGVVYFVNVAFDDNDTGSIGKKEQDEALEIQELLRENCLDKEVEFGLESMGKKNPKDGDKWKILSFPGYEPKPYTPGSNSGSDWKESWYSSEEGVRYTQDCSNRRTALMQAVEYAIQKYQGPDTVLQVADGFLAWLSPAGQPSSIAFSVAPQPAGEPTPTVVIPHSSDGTLETAVGPTSGLRTVNGERAVTAASEGPGHGEATPGHVGPDIPSAEEPLLLSSLAEQADAGGGDQVSPTSHGEGEQPPASARCTHLRVSDLNPAGKPMPKGRLRCEGCNKVFKESELS